MKVSLLPSARHHFTSASARSMRRSSTSAAAPRSPATLPRLPVPDLHQTLKRYTQSLVPFLLEQEARGGPSHHTALKTAAERADEFEQGLGLTCQQRLIGDFSHYYSTMLTMYS